MAETANRNMMRRLAGYEGAQQYAIQQGRPLWSDGQGTLDGLFEAIREALGTPVGDNLAAGGAHFGEGG